MKIKRYIDLPLIIVAIIFVNLCAVMTFLRMAPAQRSFCTALNHLVAPTLGVICIANLLVSLDYHAITLGLCWLAVGVVLMVFLMKQGTKLELEIE